MITSCFRKLALPPYPPPSHDIALADGGGVCDDRRPHESRHRHAYRVPHRLDPSRKEPRAGQTSAPTNSPRAVRVTGRRGSQRRRRLNSDSRIPESVHETGDTDRPRAEFQRPSRPSEAARALQRFHLQLPKACVADPVRPRATGMRSEGSTRSAKRVESGSHCSQESHRGQHPKKPGQPAPSPSQSRAWVRVCGHRERT